jgi:hypothetical protein
MNADEKTIRDITAKLRKGANSGQVMTGKGMASYISCLYLDAAADLIESLQAQLADLQAKYDKLAGDFMRVILNSPSVLTCLPNSPNPGKGKGRR